MSHPALRRLRTAALAAAVGAAGLIGLAGAPAAQAAVTHVANPYVGATPYLNPDYVSEVKAQAASDGGSLGTAEAQVAGYQTAIWMDHIGAITGDSTHLGLEAQLDNALAQSQSSSSPVLVEVVIYDLPGRDCAALASNGEIPATSAGLTEYESQYIDPIASILGDAKYGALRISTIVEPDSLPNAVTNQSKPACATATPFYEQGIEYALNKLHAIPNVYTYMDIAHSAWLGWSSNMSPAAQEYAKVVTATTDGYDSVDGFISDTANYTPTQEPFLTDPTLQVGGQQVESADFYQYNPYFDEYDYDNAMYSSLVSAGFPSRIGFLIDTSRNGWGGPGRPTQLNSSPTDVNSYVSANRIDQRPFRGDWCNINGAGIGARPQVQPYGASSHIIGFVWIKPPGESDGDYPSGSHTHGDPHCDPAGTQTDGNGGTYPTDAIPGYDVAAGQWFPVEFQQLVQNAYPAIGSTGGGGDTTAPSAPSGLTVTGTTGSSVSLSWTASTDNVGVTGYDVFRGSTQVGTATGTSYTDTGLSASTSYTYTVKTFDAAGNLSAASAAVSGTTASSGGGTGSSGCTAAYSVANDWGTGFTADVTVTNTGTQPTSSWTVTWSFGGDQTLTNSWNATVAQSGSAVTATGQTYDAVIAPGGNSSFGFQANYSGTNSAPTLTCTAT